MKTGFTLIELLVVVLIIGILAAIALPQYQVAVEKSRAAEGMDFIDAVYKAESIYRLANDTYTDDDSDLDLELSPLQHFSVGEVHAWGASGFRIDLDRNDGPYSYLLRLHMEGNKVYKVCLNNERICRAIGGGKSCSRNEDYAPWCYSEGGCPPWNLCK